MKVSKWKKRRYVPQWGGNREDESPCSVVFLPPNVGWMGRWKEIVLKAPQFARETTAAIQAGEDLPELSWHDDLSGFRREVIKELVVSVDDLFDEDRAMDLSDAIEFILDNPGLLDEVFQVIVDAGQVTKQEGKD
tara:strand:+ start:265 stop:669 length:405 start_codon:yes stop_codon:yes gene_type:complete